MAAGCAESLAGLYDRYGTLIFSFALRVLTRREDAEEVTQDVFTQAWRQASQYQDTRANVAAWLVMMARTRAIDRLRARRSRPDLAAVALGDEWPEVRCLAQNPEEVMISAERARQVRKALVRLPRHQLATVDFAYYQGLSHTDITEYTGVRLALLCHLRSGGFRRKLSSVRRSWRLWMT